MIVRKYKNGNIDIRYEKDYDPPLNTFDDMVCLVANQTELDVTELGEPECWGNTVGIAYPLYTVNGKTDIFSGDYEKFRQGKVLKLCFHDNF
jgi:hypothetical protein